MTTTETTTLIIPVVLINPQCPHNHLNQIVINLVGITRSPKYVEAKAEGGALTVEVASSFRPAVSSRLHYAEFRAGPQSQKWSDQQITVNPTGSIHEKAREKKFDPKKVDFDEGVFI